MNITIYTNPTCPYCRALKEFLNARAVPYTNRDVTTDPSAAQELQRMGQNGVPVILIDGQMIVGFDRPRLEQMLARGESRPLFGASIADVARVGAPAGSGVSAGALVGRVRPGSAAGRLGLLPRDVIVEINRYRISGADDLQRVVSMVRPGERLAVVFVRDGRELMAEGAL